MSSRRLWEPALPSLSHATISPVSRSKVTFMRYSKTLVGGRLDDLLRMVERQVYPDICPLFVILRHIEPSVRHG